MSKKIDKPIVDFDVIKEKQKKAIALEPLPDRPENLIGSTYKIKTPLDDHAHYVTINDIVLNPGTENEITRPFEIFINTKNVKHFQWVVALTRVISAIFRKGGDLAFLPDELQSVFDPKGGYYKTGGGGKYMNSLVAEIGDVIERHMCKLGIIEVDQLDEHQKKLIAEKKAAFEQKQANTSPTP